MTLTAFHSNRFFADIGEHVMPMRKFALVRDGLRAAGLPVQFREPSPASDEDLLRVHTPDYVRAVTTGQPRSLAESQKFPWSAQLAEAVRWTNGAAIDAASAALEHGVAAAIASGYHHAHADHGEGFCTFNGLVVALERLRSEQRLERALVVDLDLHYGNGTASLLASRPALHNLSIYGSWYCRNQASSDVTRERAEDTQNCRSVAVPNGASGAAYVETVARELPAAIERARPQLIVYQAGADPLRDDPYSPLDVGASDLAARDHLVFDTARRAGVPIAWVLAGGYTKDVTRVVDVHVATFREAVAVFGG